MTTPAPRTKAPVQAEPVPLPQGGGAWLAEAGALTLLEAPTTGAGRHDDPAADGAANPAATEA